MDSINKKVQPKKGVIKTTTKEISQVMIKLKNGEFNIPRFQREFVWKPQKIISLLKSISLGYPIGNLTTALIADNPLNGRNAIIDSIATEYDSDAAIIVDGQQRITSISIIWFANYLDKKIGKGELNKKTSTLIRKVINKVCFYNDEFFVLSDLIEKIVEQDALTSSKAKIEASNYIISNSDINILVQEKIGSYKMFIHSLLEWDLVGIIKIFQVMNKKVDALTHVDLMNGSMFSASSDNFDLIAFIKESNALWQTRGTIKPELFVILIKIFYDLRIVEPNGVKYKTDSLVEWANDEAKVRIFIDRKNDLTEVIKKTFTYLDRKLNIYTIKDIPKDVFLINIFAFVCLDYTGEEFEKYFSKVVTYTSKRLIHGYYASSPNAKAMDDINGYITQFDFDENIKEKESVLNQWEEHFKLELKNINYTNRGRAIFKLAKSILAGQHPKNLYDNNYIPIKPIDTSKNEIDIHHFIPKKSNFEKTYRFGDDLNRIGNLALLYFDENREKIRNKDMDVYLKEAEDKNPKLRESIESHLFDYDLLMNFKNYKELGPVEVHNIVVEIFQDREETIMELLKEKYFVR